VTERNSRDSRFKNGAVYYEKGVFENHGRGSAMSMWGTYPDTRAAIPPFRADGKKRIHPENPFDLSQGFCFSDSL
jgi:hypothetical protein